MTPIMIEKDEFVISFDTASGKISLKNPHGIENDDYVSLKKFIDGFTAGGGYQPIDKLDTSNPPQQKIKGYTKQEVANKYADYCKDRPDEKIPYDTFVNDILEEKVMSREEFEEYHRQNSKSMVVKGSQFYKDMVEVKETYEKLHKLGAPEGGFYRAIVWALERIDKEATSHIKS